MQSVREKAKKRISSLEKHIKMFNEGIRARKRLSKKLRREIKSLEIEREELKKKKQEIEKKLELLVGDNDGKI